MGIIEDMIKSNQLANYFIKKIVYDGVKRAFDQSKTVNKAVSGIISKALRDILNNEFINEFLDDFIDDLPYPLDRFMKKVKKNNFDDWDELIDSLAKLPEIIPKFFEHYDITDISLIDDYISYIDDEFQLLAQEIPEYEPKRSWYPMIDWSPRKYKARIKKPKFPQRVPYNPVQHSNYTEAQYYHMYDEVLSHYYSELQRWKDGVKEWRELHYHMYVKIRENLAYFTEKKGFDTKFAHDLNFTMFIGIRVPTGWTVHKLKTIDLWNENPSSRWREVIIYFRGAEFTDFIKEFASELPFGIGSVCLMAIDQSSERTAKRYPIYENLAYKSSLNDWLILANWDKIKLEFRKQYGS